MTVEAALEAVGAALASAVSWAASALSGLACAAVDWWRSDVRVAGWALLLSGAGMCALSVGWALRARRSSVKRAVRAAEPIPAQDFLVDWAPVRSGHRKVGGHAEGDGPGCYALLVDPDRRGRPEECYCGQSLHVAHRIYNHLTGHGCGDVYADVKAGRDVEVLVFRCEPEEMNDLERHLIAHYGSDASYNRTRGGGAKR